MSALSLEMALHALLLSNGDAPEQPLTGGPQKIREQLGSFGLQIQYIPLLHKTVPDEPMQIGCLLEQPGGGFIPVLGSGPEAILLDKDGSTLRTISEHELENVVQGLVITEAMESLTRLRPYFARHKKRFMEIFGAGLLINLFGLVLPLFASFVYDKVLGNGITATLWSLFIGLLIVIAVEFSLRSLRVIITERIGRESEAEIDNSVFTGLLNTQSNAIPPTGIVLEKYKQILNYRDFFSSTYLTSLADVPFLLLYVFTILIVSGPLVLVGLTCGLLIVVTSVILYHPTHDYERRANRSNEKRFTLLTDLLNSRDAVIGASLRQSLAIKWRTASLATTHSVSLARFWRGIGQSVTNSLSFLSYVGVLVGGVYMVEAQSLTSGGLLACSMLTARLVSNFLSVSNLVVRYKEFRHALNEMNKIFSTRPDTRTRNSRGPLKGRARLDHVTCRIGHSGSPVLQDISLNINPGEIIAIAGAPGGGKTTLLRLLSGLITPDEGRVLIDDIPLDILSLQDISDTIALKPQDLCLFSGTIEENVRAGGQPLSSEKRQRLLDLTGLGNSFRENGLNWATDIGQRGSHLSGGQRQLVSLARAFATDAPLLLLDEPNNGLDVPFETHLAQQISQLRGQRTVIISTHSRALLTICDRIIVVGQGRILADGPRDRILQPAPMPTAPANA